MFDRHSHAVTIALKCAIPREKSTVSHSASPDSRCKTTGVTIKHRWQPPSPALLSAAILNNCVAGPNRKRVLLRPNLRKAAALDAAIRYHVWVANFRRQVEASGVESWQEGKACSLGLLLCSRRSIPESNPLDIRAANGERRMTAQLRQDFYPALPKVGFCVEPLERRRTLWGAHTPDFVRVAFAERRKLDDMVQAR